MNCPHCGMYVSNSSATTCPRCGQGLHPAAGMEAAPSEPAQYGPDGQHAPGSYGAPGPSPYGGEQGYGYGYGGPPSGPGYGVPGYGQPGAPPPQLWGAPPTIPLWGGPMPGGMPPGWGMPQPPAPRAHTGLIVGLSVFLTLVVISAVGGLYVLASGRLGVGRPPVASAGATPTETVLFHDPLTYDAGNWALVVAHCQFADGGYQISNGHICYAPAGTISDAAISVRARQTAGITTRIYAIVLRRASKGNFYAFAIDSNSHWVFYKVVNDYSTRLVDFTASDAIKGGLNTTNTLLVRAKGSHFDCYVNGVEVGSADDSTFTSGRAGLWVGDAISVVFNDFKVTTVS